MKKIFGIKKFFPNLLTKNNNKWQEDNYSKKIKKENSFFNTIFNTLFTKKIKKNKWDRYDWREKKNYKWTIISIILLLLSLLSGAMVFL